MYKNRLKLRKVAAIVACLAVKKVAITAIALCIGLSAAAQSQGMGAIVPHIAYGSAETFGLGGKLQYNVTNPIRVEASLTYLFGFKASALANVTSNVLDLGLNAHYLFHLGDLQLLRDKWTPAYLYPLVGVGLYKATVKADALGYTVKETENKIGLNIGAGFEQNLNEKTSLFTELKAGLGKGLHRFTVLIGVALSF